MKKYEMTLCFLMKDNKILLANKKRGFGKGKYNGVGGKLEPGETKEQAMIRECQEEINAIPTEYKNVGTLEFDEYYKDEEEYNTLYLYIVTKWNGEIKESDEMKPTWFDINNIPFDNMFQDDKYWLPLILEGKQIQAYFKLDKDYNILTHEIKII